MDMEEQVKPAKKKIYKRWWFWVLAVIVVLIIIGVSSGGKNKSTQTNSGTSTSDQTNQQSPPMMVTAKQLSTDYNANEVSADAKYKGKLVQVSGTVNGINKDFLDKPYVILAGAQLFQDVHCNFTKNDESQLAALSKGQQVTFQGTVSGMVIGTVNVNDCSIVK